MPIDHRATLQSLAGLLFPPAALLNVLTKPTGSHASAPRSGPPIARLVYPEMTVLDLVGPHHFLGATDARIELVTTESTLSPVLSDLGFGVQAAATFDTCSKDLTLFFVSGGTRGTLAAARDPRTLAFIRNRVSRARYVTSFCTCSLILGAAGVLRGRPATSHWIVRDLLAQFGAVSIPDRVVRDGNVLTGAGVAAGLDFRLTLAAELVGKDEAEGILLVSDYEPEPPFPGGSPETARSEIPEAVRNRWLSQFVAEASTLQIA